jgi:ubiquitin-small subunit ribosomal protein S27Ae
MAPLSQIFLRRLDGSLAVVRASTVGELRAAACASDETRLVPTAAGSGAADLASLEDSVALADAGIRDGATINVLARLVGGGKKRKKKTYTKPKKIKHKHKKVKMATLKYYKIDGDGKVERLRRECPEDTCGAGIFMATHHDRFCCGKCGLTYVHEAKGGKA